MKTSASIVNLAAALVAVQEELKTIPFDAKNPFFKSKYTTLTAIMETVRPILAKHGLAVVQGAGFHHANDVGEIVAITIDTTLLHESGEYITIGTVMPITRGKEGYTPQGAGAAISYGKRYGVSAILALVTDEDDDGNAASGRSSTREERRPARTARR